MACGIKTMYSVRDLFPEKARILLLIAVGISHLHYPTVLFNGIIEDLLTALCSQLTYSIFVSVQICFYFLETLA